MLGEERDNLDRELGLVQERVECVQRLQEPVLCDPQEVGLDNLDREPGRSEVAELFDL